VGHWRRVSNNVTDANALEQQEAAMKANSSTATGRNQELYRLSAEFIQPWTESTSKMTTVALDCCAEAIRFAGHRFERTRDTMSSIPKCGSWDEVLKLQMDWTSGLMHDYMEESRNFFEIAQRATPEAAIPKRGNGNGGRRAS
jgi:hypothetical protein